MKLRRWQSEAIASAFKKIHQGKSHFLCLATPGAGKTHMASIAAQKMLESNLIDLVLCFTPSITVCQSFQQTLEQQLQCKMDGMLGSKGRVITYQSMLNLNHDFWTLFSRYRILVIFDEIHHCAGDSVDNANAWGQQVIKHIQGKATFTMALTGTPWRSDKIPIVLASYCEQGKVNCDYSYGLAEAIKEGVCRTPKINAIDNEQIVLQSEYQTETFSSFSEVLKSSQCTYQQLLENYSLIKYALNSSAKKLNRLRKTDKNAAGLIVAASVDHAFKIADILKNELQETAYVATYMQQEAHETIQRFKKSSGKWIISVGMISEGTDIPRLRVCCHLTRVKTELYFRQVLGRILRAGGNTNEEGYLFMPAEPNLLKYAHRVAEDIPSANTVSISLMQDNQNESPSPTTTEALNSDNCQIDILISEAPIETLSGTEDDSGLLVPPPSGLADAYDATIGLFGKFREQIIQMAAIN